MNYDDIKRLIDDVGDSKIDELSLELPDGVKICLKKTKGTVMPLPMADSVQYINVPERKVEPLKEEKTIEDVRKEGKNKEVKEEEEKDEYVIVKSPMVGTFYSKSSPNAEPYVEVGKKVKKGDVLCIVEAMKLMNEIESEFNGEIVEICAKDGEMVDYGKPLFKLILE